MITIDDIKKINSPETRAMIEKRIAAGYAWVKIGKYEFWYERRGRKHFKYIMDIVHEKSGCMAAAVDFDYNECWAKLIGKLYMDAMSAEQAA